MFNSFVKGNKSNVRRPGIHYRRNRDENCNCRKIIQACFTGRCSGSVFRNVRPRPLYPRSINSQPDDTSIDTRLVFRFSSLRWQNDGNRVIRTQPPPVPDISSRDSRLHGRILNQAANLSRAYENVRYVSVKIVGDLEDAIA